MGADFELVTMNGMEFNLFKQKHLIDGRPKCDKNTCTNHVLSIVNCSEYLFTFRWIYLIQYKITQLYQRSQPTKTLNIEFYATPCYHTEYCLSNEYQQQKCHALNNAKERKSYELKWFLLVFIYNNEKNKNIPMKHEVNSWKKFKQFTENKWLKKKVI